MTQRSLRMFIIFIMISNVACAHQPITIFCHGIVDTSKQADRYTHGLQEPKKSFDFPDAAIPEGYNLNNAIFTACNFFGKPVNRNAMHMGYDQDIVTLEQQIEPDKNYILYGVSRGGFAAITYLAEKNPENIQALIIDSAPANIISAVDEFQHAIGYKFAEDKKTQEYIFNYLFPAYVIDSKPAVENIANIANKNLPVFIVHAKTDTRVHIRSAWQLYIAFLQAGFTNVYLVELDQGKHAYYMQGPDSEKYLQALHSFYKKHNFNYDPTFAIIDNLEIFQPDIDDILKKITADKHDMQKNYEQQKSYNGIILSCLTIVTAAILIAQRNL